MKKKIFLSIIVLTLVFGGFYTSCDAKTIDGVRIYKNISNVKIDEKYLNDVQTLMMAKSSESPKDAALLAEYFIKLNIKMYGADSIETAYTYIKVSNLYLGMRIYDKAKMYNDKAFELSEKLNDELFKNVVKWNMLSYKFATEDSLEALKIIDEIDKTKFNDEQRMSFDKTYSDLYMNLGDFIKSEEYINKYGTDLKQIYGEESVNVLDYYRSKALLISSKKGKDYKNMDKIIDILDKKYQENFPDDINLLTNNVILLRSFYYRSLKEYDKLSELLDKNAKKIYDANNTYMNRTLDEIYYDLYRETKNYDKQAESLIKIENYYKNYPDNSLVKFDVYDKFAGFYRDTEGQTDIKNVKNKRSENLNKMFNLIKPYKQTAPLLYAYEMREYIPKLPYAQKEQKLAYFTEVIDIINNQLPNDYYKSALIYKDYADVLRENENIEEALNYYNKALSIYNKYLGRVNTDSAELLANIADVYDSQGNKKEGIRCLGQSINILKQVYGENSVLVYEKQLQLSKMYEDINAKKAARIFNKIIDADNKGNITGQDKEFLFNLYFMSAIKNRETDKDKALEYANKAKDAAYKKSQKEKAEELINYINI